MRTRWMLGAAALPFVAVAYMWGVFVLYSIHCEVIRNVDLGIGDTWRLPLTYGYTLTMIDAPSQAFISTPGGTQLHHELTRIGTTDRFIAVEHGGQFFLIDARSGGESSLPTEQDLQTALRADGESAIELLPPDDFYDQHRWGMADGVAGGVAFVPPSLAFLLFAWRFVRFAFASQVKPS